VLATTGLILIADATTTLLWQEPLSALMALRQQRELARELPLGRPTSRPIAPEELAGRARAESRRTRPGRALARIELPTLGRTRTVVEGTTAADLRRGPGHYPDTPLPGAGRTSGVAGHRTTFGAPFRTVNRLKRGDRIMVQTRYARLAYRVERSRVVSPRARWVVRPVGYDRLVLTACHPLYSAAQRIVVFARLESAFEVTPAARADAAPKAAPSSSEASRDSRKSTNPAAMARARASTTVQ